MGYIKAITWSLFYYVVFEITFGNILNLLQYAGNIVHKYAGRIFVIYKSYLTCMLLSSFANTYTTKHGLNAVVLLVFFSILLFIYAMGSFNATKENDATYGGNNSNFAALVGVLPVVAVWFIYYFNLYFLSAPIEWFSYIMLFLLSIPVLGNTIIFLVNTFSVFVILVPVFFLFKGIFLKIKNKSQKEKSKHTTKSTEEIIEELSIINEAIKEEDNDNIKAILLQDRIDLQKELSNRTKADAPEDKGRINLLKLKAELEKELSE